MTFLSQEVFEEVEWFRLFTLILADILTDTIDVDRLNVFTDSLLCCTKIMFCIGSYLLVIFSVLYSSSAISYVGADQNSPCVYLMIRYLLQPKWMQWSHSQDLELMQWSVLDTHSSCLFGCIPCIALLSHLSCSLCRRVYKGEIFYVSPRFCTAVLYQGYACRIPSFDYYIPVSWGKPRKIIERRWASCHID